MKENKCTITRGGKNDEVDINHIREILLGRNAPAIVPDDPRDLDVDGTITVLDARKLVQFCDKAKCGR